jgi:hypothetical protein
VSQHDKLEGYKYGWRPGMIVPMSEEDADALDRSTSASTAPRNDDETPPPLTPNDVTPGAPEPPSTPSDAAGSRIVAHLPVNMFYRVGAAYNGTAEKKIQ